MSSSARDGESNSSSSSSDDWFANLQAAFDQVVSEKPSPKALLAQIRLLHAESKGEDPRFTEAQMYQLALTLAHLASRSAGESLFEDLLEEKGIDQPLPDAFLTKIRVEGRAALFVLYSWLFPVTATRSFACYLKQAKVLGSCTFSILKTGCSSSYTNLEDVWSTCANYLADRAEEDDFAKDWERGVADFRRFSATRKPANATPNKTPASKKRPNVSWSPPLVRPFKVHANAEAAAVDPQVQQRKLEDVLHAKNLATFCAAARDAVAAYNNLKQATEWKEALRDKMEYFVDLDSMMKYVQLASDATNIKCSLPEDADAGPEKE